jgi:DNA processing protein
VVGDSLARAIVQGVDPAALQPGLDWLAGPDNHLITWNDPTYPASLRDIPAPPAWLYARGDPAWLSRPMLAIVGSRNATPQGRAMPGPSPRPLSEAGSDHRQRPGPGRRCGRP